MFRSIQQQFLVILTTKTLDGSPSSFVQQSEFFFIDINLKRVLELNFMSQLNCNSLMLYAAQFQDENGSPSCHEKFI